MKPIVVIGSGLAGYTVARELRKLDAETPLIIVSRDCGSFYSKPMLSNVFQQKKDMAALASFSAAQMGEQLCAQVMPNVHVLTLTPGAHSIAVDGCDMEYQSLVLALGADQRRPALSGDGVADICSINDLADYRHFHKAVVGKRRIAILGAGLIGCEFANDLVAAGVEVSLIDPALWPLSRFLPQSAGVAMSDALTRIGVQMWLGRTPASVDRMVSAEGPAYRIHMVDGEYIDAHLVLSAIGLIPRIALAQSAGLTTARGIVTDAWLQTSASDVYAIGDCAEVDELVLPYVMPIMQCARALARTLAGVPTKVSYPAMPVVVKTPALPTVVVPPLHPGGQWHTSGETGNLKALYRNPDDTLGGFALMGSSVQEKAALLKQIAAWRA